jgi:hypothetical protein
MILLRAAGAASHRDSPEQFASSWYRSRLLPVIRNSSVRRLVWGRNCAAGSPGLLCLRTRTGQNHEVPQHLDEVARDL